MEKKTILIALGVYVLLMGCAYFGIKKYVDIKNDRLRSDAYETFQGFFSKQDKYVSVAFSGAKVGYEKIDIPKFNTTVFVNLNSQKYQWEEDYGDLYCLYKLMPKFTPQISRINGKDSLMCGDSDEQWSGWMFNIIEYIAPNAFHFYYFCPFEVGFIKQKDSWMYNNMPSVQDAVNDAYEFYVSNDNSSYLKYFSDISIYDIINAVENEYYEMYSYDYDVKFIGKKEADARLDLRNDDFSYYSNDFSSRDDGHAGYMYNSLYKVFNKKGSIYYFQITYRDIEDPKKCDIIHYCTYVSIFLTLLFLGFIISFLYRIYVNRKKQKEGLKKQLMRMCNPKNFISPYDEKKVSAANDIYELLMDVSEEDIEALKLIRKKATTSLGISFVNQDLLMQLINMANPKRYMKPYNAEKVRIANQLYNRLMVGGLDVDEIEQIQEEISRKLTK